MRSAGEKDKLDGRIEMDDACLGGEKSGGKTGRGSPGKKPVVAAVQTDEKGRPQRTGLSRIPCFKRARVKSLAKCVIAPGATILTDRLACFRGWPVPADSMCRSSQLRAARPLTIPPSSASTQSSAT